MSGWINRRWAAIGLGILLSLAVFGGRAGAEERTFSPLVVDTAGGAKQFRVEIADTRKARQRGLMYRRSLADESGMLFNFRRDEVISMWMKNTLIPLDMIFIDRQGRIVRVHARAIPGSLAGITSGKPARAVLELAGGSAARFGIKAGDVVRHTIFNNSD